ncbi:MAG: ABC transporter substrate-binding protein [Ruminococcaceae bacterium]|nr:ABC transporter substrate-binding protein [Oscillospiraceae bacterium]
MKKIISIFLCILSLCLLFSGCGGKKGSDTGKVYYLNFKPEQDKAWKDLAAAYTEETGVEVKIVTAAEGKYEETLLAEIDKSSAPTLFQISGQISLESWKDYCLDLKDSAVYKELTSDDFAIKEGDSVYGIAYVYEGYGLIVNKKLLEKAGYKIEDINSFQKLREVAESITARKAELGFSAFTSAGLASSSSWRFSGHLANMPLFYEFEADKITSQPATIKGTYLDNYKALWDLYINNSTIDPKTLTSEQNDAAVEFKNGKAVFYQNGTWEYGNIASIGDENIGYLPIYTGIRDEKQGLCCGTENYWAVNKTASEADIKATLDFLNWVVTSEKGTTALAESMGFVSPFRSAKPVDNILCNIMNDYVAEGRYNVSWAFNFTPNVDSWRSNLVSALAAYSAGTGDWEAVRRAFVDGWAEQYKLSKQ